MNIKVLCFLPSHHENYVSINGAAEEITCPTGETYDIAEIDMDELTEWWGGHTTEKLMVTVLVPLSECIFTYTSSGSLCDGIMSTEVDEVVLTEVTIDGMDTTFYDDPSTDNEDVVDYLYRIIRSR